MSEKICAQGHVLDLGKELCSRCNGPAVVPEAIEPEVPEVEAKPVRKPRAPKKVKK